MRERERHARLVKVVTPVDGGGNASAGGGAALTAGLVFSSHRVKWSRYCLCDWLSNILCFVRGKYLLVLQRRLAVSSFILTCHGLGGDQ